MAFRGITPTLMTFNAIIDGCVRNEEMTKAGVPSKSLEDKAK